jgi:hypothetical protein
MSKKSKIKVEIEKTPEGVWKYWIRGKKVLQILRMS